MTAPNESLHSLAIRLDAQERLNAERDRLYAERHDASQEAIKAALLAAREQTAASFLASEKAIVKAEAAQLSYNQSHNDLARKMDDQYGHMMPRTEGSGLILGVAEKLEEARRDTRRELDELRQEIVSLREARSKGTGKEEGSRSTYAAIAAAVATLISLVTLVVLLANLGSTPQPMVDSVARDRIEPLLDASKRIEQKLEALQAERRTERTEP